MWTWSKFESQRARLCVTRRHFVKPADRWLFSCKLSVLNNFVLVLYIAPKKNWIRPSIHWFFPSKRKQHVVAVSSKIWDASLCIRSEITQSKTAMTLHLKVCNMWNWHLIFDCFSSSAVKLKVFERNLSSLLGKQQLFFWLLTLNHSIKNKIAEFTKIDSRAQFSKPNWIISAQKAMNIFFCERERKSKNST